MPQSRNSLPSGSLTRAPLPGHDERGGVCRELVVALAVRVAAGGHHAMESFCDLIGLRELHAPALLGVPQYFGDAGNRSTADRPGRGLTATRVTGILQGRRRATCRSPVACPHEDAQWPSQSRPRAPQPGRRVRESARAGSARAPLSTTFVDLGMSPLCQTHISTEQLNSMEPFYPLHAYVCDQCFLVQLEQFVAPDEIFTDYAYLSSYSDSWVEHARRYASCDATQVRADPEEPGDRNCQQRRVSPPALRGGGHPSPRHRAGRKRCRYRSAERHPNDRGVLRQDQRPQTQARNRQPDLLLGNNVLAHVPDINDFVAGMKMLLKPGGVITMEFPHLMRLMQQNQFDTIYHEHFSYLAFFVVEKIFRQHGLRLFDVEELSTHGGSFRIFACHADDELHTTRYRRPALSGGV